MRAAAKRRTLGTDPGTHSGGASTIPSPRPQADTRPPGSRSRTLDSQHRCPVAHAVAVLSELQKTVYLRFQCWCRQEVLRGVLTSPANALRDEGAFDESECFIDATFASARGGSAETGPSKRGKGMNNMAIVGRHEVPLAVGTHVAGHHDVTLVQLSFEFYMIEAKPEDLIGDRAYDSDKLDEELRQEGNEMISPYRQGRVKPGRRTAADCVAMSGAGWGPLLHLYSVATSTPCRWECYAGNSLGFVQQAAIGNLLRQLL